MWQWTRTPRPRLWPGTLAWWACPVSRAPSACTAGCASSAALRRACSSLFERGLLNGTTHACIGQEADAVAIMEHLGDDDHVFSNHRCHGHFLARTGDALGLMAEIMGKPEGVCGGIGGSQHLCAPGFMSNGVQGGIVPNAAGIALAKQLDGSAGLSVVFIGDGTLGEGATYETLNLASLWRLPLVVVLEDNEWAQSTPFQREPGGQHPRPLHCLRDSRCSRSTRPTSRSSTPSPSARWRRRERSRGRWRS